MSANPHPSTISFKSSSLITFRVGQPPTQDDFAVHEDIISRSEFFQHAINGDWKEADTRVIDMPEDDPDSVSLYLQLAYTNVVTRTKITNHQEQLYTESLDLSKIYVLAEKLQDMFIKNKTIYRMFALIHEDKGYKVKYVPRCDAINTVYEGTLEGNKMRRLLRDLWFLAPHIDSDLNTLPREFLHDLIVGYWLGSNTYAVPNVQYKDVKIYLEVGDLSDRKDSRKRKSEFVDAD